MQSIGVVTPRGAQGIAQVTVTLPLPRPVKAKKGIPPKREIRDRTEIVLLGSFYAVSSDISSNHKGTSLWVSSQTLNSFKCGICNAQATVRPIEEHSDK